MNWKQGVPNQPGRYLLKNLHGKDPNRVYTADFAGSALVRLEDDIETVRLTPGCFYAATRPSVR
jgi:hypothetical protein